MSEFTSPSVRGAGPSRRGLLEGVGKATLSATALAMLAGCAATRETSDRAAQPTPDDVTILNAALGHELEVIVAYHLWADSGLLGPSNLDLANAIRAHHEGHRDVLIRVVGKLGGRPTGQPTVGDVIKKMMPETVRTENDVLAMAQATEKDAANAYLGNIPKFEDPRLRQFAGRVAADESMHWTALTQALGQKMPKQALSFSFG